MEKKIYFLLTCHRQVTKGIFVGLVVFCITNVLIAARYNEQVLYGVLAISAVVLMLGIVASGFFVERKLMYNIRQYLADPATDTQSVQMLYADFCNIETLRHLIPVLDKAIRDKFIAGYRGTQFCIQSRITAKVRDLTEEMTVATATA